MKKKKRNLKINIEIEADRDSQPAEENYLKEDKAKWGIEEIANYYGAYNGWRG